MYIVCVETSFKKGLGHFYRSFNLIQIFKDKKINTTLIINNYKPAIKILKKNKYKFEIVNFNKKNWQDKILKKYNVSLWINDILNTKISFIKLVQKNSPILLIDDFSSSRFKADYNVFTLPSTFYKNNLKSKNKFANFFLLNPSIKNLRYLRNNLEKIIISIGGTDDLNLTEIIFNKIKNMKYKFTIILGPGSKFKIKKNYQNYTNIKFIRNPKFLIKIFTKHDLAITAGGITALESSALGLPILAIPTSIEEKVNVNYLEKKGCAKIIGYKKNIMLNSSIINNLNIRLMSKNGLMNIKGINNNKLINIFKRIKK